MNQVCNLDCRQYPLSVNPCQIVKLPVWFHFKPVGRCKMSRFLFQVAGANYPAVAAVKWRAPEIKPPDQWSAATGQAFNPKTPGTMSAFSRLSVIAREDVPKPHLSDL